MRLYTFVNHYLSPIQHGIQTAHVVAELFNKYMTKEYYGTHLSNSLIEWSTTHKTIIVLNGGFSSNLMELEEKLGKNHPYPVASFREGENELNNALTAVGIILPKKIYSINSKFYNFEEEVVLPLEGNYVKLNSDDIRISSIIRQHKLA